MEYKGHTIGKTKYQGMAAYFVDGDRYTLASDFQTAKKWIDQIVAEVK